MALAKIAFRNIIKNRRRSLITVLAIAFGYMAVAMFKGYTHNAYERMAMGAIFLEGPGHIVFFKKGYLDEGRIDPYRYLLSGEDVEQALHIITEDPDVVWAAPKLTLSGLITNGAVSTIFLADALEPTDEKALWTHWDFPEEPTQNTSRVLPTDRPYAAYFGPALAHLLQMRPGDTAVLMATTVEGQMNAVDVELVGTYPTFSDATDDKYVKITLSLARELYDFDGADRVCVLTRDKSTATLKRNELVTRLRSAGLNMEARTWDELSLYYQKARDFLDVVFMFIFIIVLLIVVMSTFNTMSMAVFERTREIGTLRAIGMRPRAVVMLFSVEGLLLGLFGSLAGLGLTAIGFAFLRVAHFTYKPPGVSDPVTIGIDLQAQSLLLSLIFFLCLSAFSAMIPARRAARDKIVEALGHV